MSGELQPFELMYAPRGADKEAVELWHVSHDERGLPINVAQRPAIVDEALGRTDRTVGAPSR